MQVVNLVQGSPEWHAHRRNYFNASDAPAMMGLSKYETRNELLHRIKTGIVKEVSPAVQALFDKGHRFEALARPLAEKIIGEDLSPVVAINGKYSASFDGITFGYDINFEHKKLNEELAACKSIDDLDISYKIQMEHQTLVSESAKSLFMASDWDENDQLINKVEFWYETDPELRQRVIDGWEQFERDLAAYVPPVVVETLEAEPVDVLPVPSVVVKGEITQSNLADITPKFDAYLKSIKTELSTDQDFADAEANAKNCRETAKRIEAIQENIIAQMVSVNEVNGILTGYKQQFNNVGLKLEKAVKEQKENLKTIAVMSAQKAFSEHVALLEAETRPIRLNVAVPDFGGAIKGIKTVASMHSRINDAMAAGKMNADAVARDIRAKQVWLKENADGYQFLFADINTIIHKPMDDLQTLAKLRINEHKEAEAEKAKAMQEQAEAAARAKIEQEQLEAEAEKAEPVQRANTEVSQPDTARANAVEAVSQKASSSPVARILPSRQQILAVVSVHFGISDEDSEQAIIAEFSLRKAA